MALTIDSQTTEAISLEEYQEYVTSHVNVRDLDSVCSSADKLKALANNRTFLIEHFNQSLRDWRNFQLANSYTAQTLLLGGGPDFVIRANIWTPVTNDASLRAEQKRLFVYDVPHDHNFSFLTVGYFGPGYETTIYEYDPKRVTGKIGEKVELRFLETTTLPAGKMMLYRMSRDVHTQNYPENFSISLNLLLAPPETNQREQFLFDLESSRIAQYARNTASTRLMMCRAARYIGDSRTATLLDELASRHSSARVRLTATESLAMLEPSCGNRIWGRAAADESPLVREYAVKQLERDAVAGPVS
jgi:hypothetical protein